MDYLKLDPRIFDRPEFRFTGWTARHVYLSLLMVSAKYDLRGEFRGGYADGGWLAENVGWDETIGGEHGTELAEVLDHMLSTGVLVGTRSAFAIPDWSVHYAPKDPTNAKRQADYRARKLLAVTTVSNGTQLNTTQLNTTPPLPPTGGDGSVGKSGEEVFDGKTLASLWNTHKPAACPRCLTLDGRRGSMADARAEEAPLIEGMDRPTYWRTVIQRLGNIPWMVGVNDRKWVANFDYLIRPGTVAKILEQSESSPKTPGQTRTVAPGEELYGSEG